MMWQHNHGFGVESKHGRMYRVVVHVAFGATVAGLIAVVFGYFVMLLWNGVLPQVTAARSISYWQAVGLLLLAPYSCGRPERARGLPRTRLSARKALVARVRPVVE